MMRDNFGLNPIATPTGTVQIVPMTVAASTRVNVNDISLPTRSQSALFNCANNFTTLTAPQTTATSAAIATHQLNTFLTIFPNSTRGGIVSRSPTLPAAGAEAAIAGPDAVAIASLGCPNAISGIQTRLSTHRNSRDLCRSSSTNDPDCLAASVSSSLNFCDH